jgi:hypothetical protein
MLNTTSINNVQYFVGKSVTAGGSWDIWYKPPGKTMLHIFLIGKGGNGGGVTDLSAEGASGGGSGAQTIVLIPLALLPDRLYLSLGGISDVTTLASYISVAPNTTANNTVVYAAGGANGAPVDNTALKAGGAGGTVATAALMPLGWCFVESVLAGQQGASGGGDSNGSPITLPTTGLRVTGGAGGGSYNSGPTNGGAVNGAGIYPTIPAGTPETTVVTVAITAGGSTGFYTNGMFLGGSGSGSYETTASPPITVPSGTASYGCGGGGCAPIVATGASTIVGGRGGPALAVLTCW